MTKLFEKGIEAIRALPRESQDTAGELLLALAGRAPQYELTSEQLDDLRLAISDADRGEFGTDDEMAETWKKFGL
jgi:hypothetical protein